MGFFLGRKKNNEQQTGEMNIEVKQAHDAAETGDPDAQYKLALMYMEGKGVKKNEKTAVFWLKKASDQEHIEAMKKLSWCYLNGRGVKQSLYESVALSQKVSGKGQEIDMNKYGMLVRK